MALNANLFAGLERNTGLQPLSVLEHILNMPECAQAASGLAAPKSNILPYKRFPGSYVTSMAQLREQGYLPLTVADVERVRLAVLNLPIKEIMHAWWDSCILTSDGAALHQNGGVKLAINAQQLRDINGNSKLSVGALVLDGMSDDAYEAVEGTRFSRLAAERYTGHKQLPEEFAMSNRFFKAFAPAKQYGKLSERYAAAVAQLVKAEYDKDARMGINLSPVQKMPTMRAWLVGSIRSSSHLACYADLDQDQEENGVLIGRLPQMPGKAVNNYINRLLTKSGLPEKEVIALRKAMAIDYCLLR